MHHVRHKIYINVDGYRIYIYFKVNAPLNFSVLTSSHVMGLELIPNGDKIYNMLQAHFL